MNLKKANMNLREGWTEFAEALLFLPRMAYFFLWVLPFKRPKKTRKPSKQGFPITRIKGNSD